MRPVLRMMVTLEFQRATGRCSQEGQEMVLEMQLARPRLCLKGRWRWAVRDAALAGMTLFFFLLRRRACILGRFSHLWT